MLTADADADVTEDAAAAADTEVPSVSGQATAYGGVTEDAGVRVGRTKKGEKATTGSRDSQHCACLPKFACSARCCYAPSQCIPFCSVCSDSQTKSNITASVTVLTGGS